MTANKKTTVKKSSSRSDRRPLVRVAVVGVGGGGGNAISRMRDNLPRDVEFIAINTDIQDLEVCNARTKIHIGQTATHGLGAGMNPELGARSAEENKAEIAEALEGIDLIFLTAGFGGGTGTGALPVVAEVAKESGALTVAVITKPFSFEGSQRNRIAQEGLAQLRDKVDSLIVIPNDRIFSVINKDTPIMKAFVAIDEVLKNSVAGIVDLIISPGIINVDFADIRAVMQGTGSAIVGVGLATGGNRATDAAQQAISSPLLEVNADGAKGVLFGVSGCRDLKMGEINEAARIITESVDPAAKIIFGAYHDKRLKKGQVKVTLIATGFSNSGRSLSGSLFNARGEATGNNLIQRSLPKEMFEQTEANSSSDNNDPSLTDKPATTSHLTKKSKEAKSESMWDIPTFLRRKKK